MEKLGKYSSLIVRQFYATYAATIVQDLPKGKKALDHPKFRKVLVRGRQVNISVEKIYSMIFGLIYIGNQSL